MGVLMPTVTFKGPLLSAHNLDGYLLASAERGSEMALEVSACSFSAQGREGASLQS